jgi:type I restriction enzyme S subunit
LSGSQSVKPPALPVVTDYILQRDDVIMGRRGEMGRCGLVSKKEAGWFCGTGSLYLRPNKDIVYAPFLFYYMGSSTVKEFLTGSAKGTTMKNLNKKIVSNIPINLPKTVNEQIKIVKEIESRLSICDEVMRNIGDNLDKAEALRQSILKKAFEGNLLNEVELDQCKKADDYEPAQVLLERIKAEKN